MVAGTYDCLITLGAIAAGHIGEECFPEMMRVVKPGLLFLDAIFVYASRWRTKVDLN